MSRVPLCKMRLETADEPIRREERRRVHLDGELFRLVIRYPDAFPLECPRSHVLVPDVDGASDVANICFADQALLDMRARAVAKGFDVAQKSFDRLFRGDGEVFHGRLQFWLQGG